MHVGHRIFTDETSYQALLTRVAIVQTFDNDKLNGSLCLYSSLSFPPQIKI